MAYRGGDLNLRTGAELPRPAEPIAPRQPNVPRAFDVGRGPPPAPLESPLRLDETVQEALSLAEQVAMVHRSDRVGLVHLLYALATISRAQILLEQRGISAAALRREAGALLASLPESLVGLRIPVHSVELDQALRLAATLRRIGNRAVSVADILEVLQAGVVGDPAAALLARHLPPPQPEPPPRDFPDLRMSEPPRRTIPDRPPFAPPPRRPAAADGPSARDLTLRIEELERRLAQAPRMSPTPIDTSAAHDLIAHAQSLERALQRSQGETAMLSERMRALEITLQQSTAAPPPRQDDVTCAVYAPRAVAAGGLVRVQAVLHRGRDQEAARRIAQQVPDAGEMAAATSLADVLPRGTRVAITLESDDATVRDTTQFVVWNGKPTLASFLAIVPEAAIGRHALFRIVVRLGQRPIGTVSFGVTVTAETRADPQGQQELEVRAFRNTFVSYASEDRPAVLDHIKLYPLFTDGIFMDVLNLEPGQRWERQLYRRIDGADLFLLFWSRHAARSPWVVREAEYALARQQASGGKSPAIFPFILDGPPPAARPPSLQAIHFDSVLQYVLAAEINARGERVVV